MKKQFLIALITLIAFFGAYNYFNGKWSLFFYPDGCLGCVEKWVIQANSFSSKDKCRDAGYAMNRARGSIIGDTFECGYRCKKADETGYLCKITEDF